MSIDALHPSRTGDFGVQQALVRLDDGDACLTVPAALVPPSSSAIEALDLEDIPFALNTPGLRLVRADWASQEQT